MLNGANLSLEQAPPITVPLRFFLTAPLFAVLAGLLLMFSGAEVLASRWTPAALALTHAITLGFLALVMAGALLQLLPVVAGSPVPRPRLVATAVHGLLAAGTLALMVAFHRGSPGWMGVATGLLAPGLVLLLTAVGISLARVRLGSATVAAMRLALLALLLTAALGLALSLALASGRPWPWQLTLTDAHLGWGLLGWVGGLVAGVAYQVVPMFQLTAEYPLWMRRSLAPALLAALALWLLLLLAATAGRLPAGWAPLALSLAGCLLAAFGVTTLALQQRRRRRLTDVTLRYWRVGMAGLLLSLLAWVTGLLIPALGNHPRYPLLLGATYLAGFAVPVVIGMLYKVVPFLVWFHLQNRQLALQRVTDVKVPNMKEVLPDALGRRQLRVYLAFLLLLGLALLAPVPFAPAAGLALVGAAVLLWLDLLRAARIYRRINAALLATPYPATPS